MKYIIVTNASETVVGKDVYTGDAAANLTAMQANYPALTFTEVSEATFTSTTFVGPNYTES